MSIPADGLDSLAGSKAGSGEYLGWVEEKGNGASARLAGRSSSRYDAAQSIRALGSLPASERG